MIHRWKLALMIMPALLLLGLLLLAACDQGVDFQPPENDQSQEKTTQDSKPTSNEPADSPSPSSATPSEPTASPENKTPSTDGDSTTDGVSSNTPGTTTPPAGGDTTIPETPWSDYEYYKQLKISRDTCEVQTIVKWHPGYEDKVVHLLQELRDEVVPQAVASLVERFPKTFGHMVGKEIGMGVAFNSNDTSAVAALSAALPTDDASQYGLIVGYGNFVWEGDVLSANSRREMEAYVVHEMMHGLMSESLTCGYFGCDSSIDIIESQRFPLWFQEGTAEAVCGGARNLRFRLKKQYPNSVVNGTEVLDAETERQLDVTAAEMKDFINTNPLVKSRHSSVAAYQTGWLAVMYLGYLANGGSDMSPSSIAAGLDTLMGQVRDGASLSEAIRRSSCNKFSSIGDFESKFTGENSEVVDFVVKLMNAIGSGRGSVLVDSYKNFTCIPNDSDLLPDQAMDSRLFWLYINANNVYTNKIYGDDYPLLEGGFGN